MNLARVILFFLSMIFAGLVFANEPSYPYIVGPTRVKAGLQNVRYSLVNFNHTNISNCLWRLEDTFSHIMVTNKVYGGSLSTSFNIPDAQTFIIIDVEVSYFNENMVLETQLFVLEVRSFLITLHNVRRNSIDGNNYTGLENNVAIHFNIDNDVRDNNGDYFVPGPTSIDDNDLLSMTFELYPANVYMGYAPVLQVGVAGANSKLWSSRRKNVLYASDGHNYVLPSHDLYSVKDVTFYVEACALGASYIKVYIDNEQIDSSMQYNAYAVMDGDQPRWLERSILEYQTLTDCEWSLIFPIDNIVSSYLHSSLAYAVDPYCSTYGEPFIVQKNSPRVPSPSNLVSSNFYGAAAYYTNVDDFGNCDGFLDIYDLLSFFQSSLWPCNYNMVNNYGEIIYYYEFHAARKYSGCSGIMSTWRMYKSKYTAGTIFIYRDTQLTNEGNIVLNFDEELAK